MTSPFSYEEFTQRNLGFIDEREQAVLRAAKVFVCGVGGMGGACLQALVRAGIGSFALADFDAFEVSNLNRQVFATLDSVGADKVKATEAQLLRINPQLELKTFGAEWLQGIDAVLSEYKLVVNGMDDVRAGIALYRKAREHRATIIDAYTSPLPSVFVVGPDDPRPEERLGYPSVGIDADALTSEQLQTCVGLEIEHVLIHSSSARHVDLGIAKDLLSGKRKRMSFAPMVITTGNLMAFEAIKQILKREPRAQPSGYFFNPWSMRVERPRNRVVASIMRTIVRRFIAKLTR